MENLIEQQIEKNKRLINEGRMEGIIIAATVGFFYLILVAAVMELI